jgi:urea transporter
MLADQALTFDEGLRFGALINGIFTAIVLGAGLVAPTAASYVRALLGVLLSVLLTLALAAPLGRLGLSPVSLPFNLTIFAALLIARQRESQYPSTFVKTKE